MLIFEAWDKIGTAVEYIINELYRLHEVKDSDELIEAFQKCDGLMDMLMMKIDSMEDEITITREEISEALGYEK